MSIQQGSHPISRDEVTGRGQVVNTRRIITGCRRAESAVGVLFPSWIYLAGGEAVVKRSHLIVVQKHVVSRWHPKLEGAAAILRYTHEKERHHRDRREPDAQQRDQELGSPLDGRAAILIGLTRSFCT